MAQQPDADRNGHPVALVTGASRGIGAAVARIPELAERGVRLLVISGDMIEGTITPKLIERVQPGYGVWRWSGALCATRRRMEIAPVPFAQPVADYIAAFHARNGLARERMGASAPR